MQSPFSHYVGNDRPFILYDKISRKKHGVEETQVIDLFRKSMPYDVSSITKLDSLSSTNLKELFSSVLGYLGTPGNMFENEEGEIILYFEGTMPDGIKQAAVLSTINVYNIESSVNDPIDHPRRIMIYQLSTSPVDSFWNKANHLMAMFLYATGVLMTRKKNPESVREISCNRVTEKHAKKNKILGKVKNIINPTIISAQFIDNATIISCTRTMNEENKRRYHAVRGHVRTLKNGSKIMVRAHTRGDKSKGQTVAFYRG